MAQPGAIAGAIVLTAMILLAVFAPIIAPYDPIAQDSAAIRAAPSAEHLFGADTFGRDIFSRVLYGGRMSLPVGFVAVGITAVVGVALGLIAGYYGGRIDTIVMRWVDLMLAFPGILLAMALVAILGTSLFNLMLAVGIAAIPEYTRVVRGTVLSAREAEYVTAARVSGSARPSDRLAPHPAQCAAAGDRAGHAGYRRGDHPRFDALLPRSRHQAADPGVGQHAVRWPLDDAPPVVGVVLSQDWRSC